MYRPSLLLSLVVPSALLAGSAVAATRTFSGSPGTSSTSGATADPAPRGGETATPAGLVFGDVDGDGKDDAFVVGAEGQARLLMNFGEGHFEDVTLAANLAELGGATCALFADLDGDGRLDLFAGSSATRVWKNLGNATFEPMASGIEHDLVDLAAQAVDRDQDGRLDLQIHTEAGDLVYRNLGEGRFERLALPLGDLPQAPSHVGWVAPDSVDATDTLAAPDAGTPAQRRLGRWVQGRAAGGFASAATSAPSGASSFGPSLPFLATCQPGVRDANGSACIGASSVPTLGKLYPLSTNFNIDAATGNVGFGMSPIPGKRVTAQGAVFADLDNLAGLPSGSEVGISSPGGRPGMTITLGDGSGGPARRYDMYISPTNALSFRDSTAGADRLTIDTSGNVGIGPTSPAAARLQVVADSYGIRQLSPTHGSDVTTYCAASGGWIGTRGNFPLNFYTADSQAHLTITTGGLVSVKNSLEVRGGADIVERFESSCGVLEPGTVVAIDPENPGQLSCSFDAYDTKVAGVVSGAGGVKPGLCLTQDGHLDGDTPVAMTGRVYVKCSTENGAIRPGDRLTTAALAGHAMKVTDEQRSVGAVIGKAMSALDEGTGLVLVLVNLQ